MKVRAFSKSHVLRVEARPEAIPASYRRAKFSVDCLEDDES